ncbi:hypothetical protein D3C86_1945730 [compost metagenome]
MNLEAQGLVERGHQLLDLVDGLGEHLLADGLDVVSLLGALLGGLGDGGKLRAIALSLLVNRGIADLGDRSGGRDRSFDTHRGPLLYSCRGKRCDALAMLSAPRGEIFMGLCG